MNTVPHPSTSLLPPNIQDFCVYTEKVNVDEVATLLHTKSKGCIIRAVGKEKINESLVKLIRLTQQYFYRHMSEGYISSLNRGDFGIFCRFKRLQNAQLRKIIPSPSNIEITSRIKKKGQLPLSSSEPPSLFDPIDRNLEALQDILSLRNINPSIQQQMIFLFFSEIRYLTRCQKSIYEKHSPKKVSSSEETCFDRLKHRVHKANAIREQVKKIFPHIHLPRVELYRVGCDENLIDLLAHDICPYAFESGERGVQPILNIAQQVIDGYHVWRFLSAHRGAYFTALLKEFQKESDMKNISPALSDLIARYPYGDIHAEELKRYGWSNEQIRVLIQKAPRIHTLDLSNTNCSLDALTPQSSVKRLFLSKNRSITDTALYAILARCPELEELNLSWTNVTLKGITLPKTLKKCILSGNKTIASTALQTAITHCRKLEKLNLGWTNISLSDIGLSKMLKRLNLKKNDSITNEALKAVAASCQSLEALNISLTGISLAGVVFPKTLKKLNLRVNDAVTNQHFTSAIAGCSELEVLDVSWTHINLEGITLPGSLKKLFIRKIYGKVSGQTLKTAIAHCHKLEELKLSFCDISLQGFSFPKTLRRLDLLSSKGITDGDLKIALANCHSLEELDIGNTDITLKDITLPSSLRVLSLFENESVTDEALKAAIAHCHNLKTVDIGGTNISMQNMSLNSTFLSRGKEIVFLSN